MGRHRVPLADLDAEGRAVVTIGEDEIAVFLVDGVELLAYLLHPEAFSDPGIPWSRVRL